MSRLAVVLFNLGGPDRPGSIEPFLFNLFNDPEIIGAPGALRWLLARLLSRRRAAEASAIYQRLGGKSPLLDNTRLQAEALEVLLGDTASARVFIAMRYWHPMSVETAEAVKAFAADEIVLLPLYPSFPRRPPEALSRNGGAPPPPSAWRRRRVPSAAIRRRRALSAR